MRLLFSTVLTGFFSLGAVAHAESVRGPAGTFELPAGMTATMAPANPAHPNLDASAIITLTNAQSAAIGPVTLVMSCAPAIGQLNSPKGMERLAAMTFQLDKTLKPGESQWTSLDAFQTYRAEASRSDGTRLTQWMVPLGTSFAWIKFDRPRAFPMDQDVLHAIEGMKIICGQAAKDGKA